MPGLNGLDSLNELKKINSELPVPLNSSKITSK